MKNLSNMNCVIAGVHRFFLIGIDIGNLTSASIWECILVKNPANVINEVTLLHSFPSWPYIFQHTHKKPYSCKECNYCCASQVQLTRHIRTHAGEKHYKCQSCDYCSANQFTMIRHHRKHTGLKCWEDPSCDYHCVLESGKSSKIQ